MSSAPRFQLPYAIFQDPNGVPLPYAQLLFYVSGTSIAAPTYSNNSLTLVNPNPVLAAEDGLFPSIFLNGALTYKVVLEDENGNQLWTADPVVQIGSLTGPTVTIQEAAKPAGVASAVTIYTPDGETLEYVDGADTARVVATMPIVDNTGNFTNASIEVDFGGRVIAASSGSINLANGAEFSYTVASGATSDLPSIPVNVWTQRGLNTTNYNGIAGCSLASNQVTLPIGLYLVTYRMGVLAVSPGGNLGTARFRDTTNGVSHANSPLLEVFNSDGVKAAIISQSAIISVASPIVCELDIQATNGAGLSGGGPATTGDSEVYVQLSILQIAS